MQPTHRDKRGRVYYTTACSGCGTVRSVRQDQLHKQCRSCACARGRGFPPGTLTDTETLILTKWSWHINGSGYVTHAAFGELHRVVMGLAPGDPAEVHHINHNKLDCRRDNLQLVSHSENLTLSWKHRKQHEQNPPTFPAGF